MIHRLHGNISFLARLLLKTCDNPALCGRYLDSYSFMIIIIIISYFPYTLSRDGSQLFGYLINVTVCSAIELRTVQVQLTHAQRDLQRATEVTVSGTASVEEELTSVRKRCFLILLQ